MLKNIKTYTVAAGTALLITATSSATASSLHRFIASDYSAAVRSCRANLDETGRQVFDHVAPDIQSDTNITELLRAKVRPLLRPKVIGGTISRQTARESTERAGLCLAELKSQQSTITGERNGI
ncbi:MAG: hypothetical protein CBB77_02330 [Hyphomonas sp. TMED17]|nr:MAG: hypothetical protein CBB77_02330 [Hyphomonas sp. TMED17]